MENENKQKKGVPLIVLIVVCLVAFVGAFILGNKLYDVNENIVNKKNNKVEDLSVENNIKKAYTIEKLTDGTTLYRNTESIEILILDADVTVIKERLNEGTKTINMGDPKEDDEFGVLKIEDNTVVLDVTHYDFHDSEKLVKSKFVVTAIKNPVSIYSDSGIGGEDSYPIEYYVKDSNNKVYSVSFFMRDFDGYKVNQINEINADNLTKYLIKEGNDYVDIYSSGFNCSDHDDKNEEEQYKSLYSKSNVQCGYRGIKDKCEYEGKNSVITFVSDNEAYEAYIETTNCDPSMMSEAEGCINSKSDSCVDNQLTKLKNVSDVNMDIDPELYRVVYISTKDGKLYYFVREKKQNDEGIFSLIRVNTPLKFVKFVKNIEMNNGTKTVFELSDGNQYIINYDKNTKTISLHKYIK